MMESVFQILAVLTRHSTKFLYQKNGLDSRSTSIEEIVQNEVSLETNNAIGSSVRLEQDTNTDQTDYSGHATSSTNLLPIGSHLVMSKESIDALANDLFDKVIDTLDSGASTKSHSLSDSTDTVSLASSVFDKLTEQLERNAPSDSDVNLDRTICRICYGTEEAHLLSICHCKGSIAHVHVQCIERWLQECGVDTCDLCKYKFITVRKPTQSKLKSLLTWLTHADSREDMEELVSDSAVTFLFSPFIILLTLSGYQTMITRTISMFVPDANQRLVFSLSGTLSTISLFTFLTLVNSIGLSWICYVGNKHFSRWQAWYRRTTIVRIVLPENSDGSR